MFLKVNEMGRLQICMNKQDQCLTCINAEKCTFLSALQHEVVILKYESVSVSSCLLYKNGKNKVFKEIKESEKRKVLRLSLLKTLRFNLTDVLTMFIFMMFLVLLLR